MFTPKISSKKEMHKIEPFPIEDYWAHYQDGVYCPEKLYKEVSEFQINKAHKEGFDYFKFNSNYISYGNIFQNGVR